MQILFNFPDYSKEVFVAGDIIFYYEFNSNPLQKFPTVFENWAPVEFPSFWGIPVEYKVATSKMIVCRKWLCKSADTAVGTFAVQGIHRNS